jgi:hypothetical protein
MAPKPRRDPKLRNIVWDPATPGKATAMFLSSPRAVEWAKRLEAGQAEAQSKSMPRRGRD